MKISLITVTYNAERFIAECLASVSAQVGVDLEHIIIDGLSTDNTIPIIHQHRDSIQKFVSEKDAGMYDALNKGIALATGDIVGVLHADDFFASGEVLSKVADAFLHSKADVLYGDLWYVDREDTSKVVRKWESKPYRHGLFQWGWMPPHPTFFAKRHIFEKYGCYRLDMGTASDFELMIRFLHKQRLKSYYLPEVLVKMRTGGMSNKSVKSRFDANKADFKAMRLNGIRFPYLAVLLKPVRKIPQFFKGLLSADASH